MKKLQIENNLKMIVLIYQKKKGKLQKNQKPLIKRKKLVEKN